MNILKTIEPNAGVNVLEEDRDFESEEDLIPNDTAVNESVFSTTKSRFKILKQGEPFINSVSDKTKMSKQTYSVMSSIRNYNKSMNVSDNQSTMMN